MKTSLLETMTPQYIIDNTGKKKSVVAEKILAKGEKEMERTLEEIEESFRKQD